ncbi:hypothetical protein EBS02_05750 [bacterium]|nr:hypothetical protein [bacterium]
MTRASKSTLFYPYSVRVSPNAEVYVTDTYNHRIRKLTKNGLFTYISEQSGKMIKFPSDIAFSESGDVYIADSDFCQIVVKDSKFGLLRRLDVENKGKCLKLSFPSQIDFHEGKLYIADTMGNRIVIYDTIEKTSYYFEVTKPLGICLNRKTKEIIFTKKNSNQIFCYKDNAIEVYSGSLIFGFSDGKHTASFFEPYGLSSREDGTVVVADCGNHSIREIDIDRVVSTVAGGRDKGHQDGTEALFNSPIGVSTCPDGSIYVADTYNHALRLISNTREVSTVA